MAYYPNPPIVTIPATPWILSGFESPVTWGPQFFGGARYICGNFQAGPNINLVEIIKSTDGGATWTAQDTGNLPDIDGQFGETDFAFDLTNGVIHIVGFRGPSSGNNLSYCSFDMNTDTFGASVDGAIRAGSLTPKIDVRADGTPIAFFTKVTGAGVGTALAQPIQYSAITAGAFSAAVDLVAGISNRLQNPLSTILDSAGTMHLCYQNSYSNPIPPDPQNIRHVSLTSADAISAPTVIYTNVGSSVWNSHLPVGIGQEFGGNLYWAVEDTSGGTGGVVVRMFKGSPAATPSWTTLTVADLSGDPALTPTFQAHIVPFGTGLAVFYFEQFQNQTVQKCWYVTFDGATFSAPILAWDVHTNTIAGGPTPPEACGYFSIAVNPNGVELAGNAFIDTDFNQSVVFLSPIAVGIDCGNPPDGTVGVAY